MITIIDVTAITGPTFWITEKDIADRIIEKIRSAGWPDNQVKLQFKSNSVLVDILLETVEQKPRAVIQVRRDSNRLRDAMDQACGLSLWKRRMKSWS